MPDLEMYRGNDRVFSLDITRGGYPINLTLATLRFLARKSVTDPDVDAVITKVTGAGIVTTDASNGMVDLEIASADTIGLYAPTALVFDIELTEGNGDISTPVQGVLLVKRTMIPL